MDEAKRAELRSIFDGAKPAAPKKPSSVSSGSHGSTTIVAKNSTVIVNEAPKKRTAR